MNEPTVTITGNLTADPELRYTQNGIPVANFTIAATPRTFDRNSNEWVDGETVFLRSTLWREYAENVSNSLTKGSRVVATGTLSQHSYETAEGEKRVSLDFQVDEIGPSLRYARAEVTRVVQDVEPTPTATRPAGRAAGKTSSKRPAAAKPNAKAYVDNTPF